MDFDDPIYGVANENHDGATADGRQTGTEIEISVSDTALYKYDCSKVYTLTDGSTTTAVDSSLVPQTNDFWINGYIEIVTCAADSSLIGKRVKITDSVGASGTLTLAETLSAALASGDTIKLCPGNYAHGYLGWDLDADAMNPDFDAIGGTVLELYDTNPKRMECTFRFRRSSVTS